MVINIKLSDKNWTQSTLHVALGGLGVRAAVNLLLPACQSLAAHMLKISYLISTIF